MAINSIQLYDHRPTQRRVRNAIAEHNPAIGAPALPPPGVGDVNYLVAGAVENRQRANAGLLAQNPPRTARRILAVSHR